MPVWNTKVSVNGGQRMGELKHTNIELDEALGNGAKHGKKKVSKVWR